MIFASKALLKKKFRYGTTINSNENLDHVARRSRYGDSYGQLYLIYVL
jgi:hypothetical protein